MAADDANGFRFAVPTRIALWLLAFVLVVNAVLGGALVVTRIQQNREAAAIRASDERFHQLVVCQVHHNTLTAQALAARDGASKQATADELAWLRGVRHALNRQTLTGPVLQKLIDTYISGLLNLQVARFANPYPPGGLCEQLVQRTTRGAR